MSSEIFSRIQDAIINFDEDLLISLTETIKTEEIDPLKAIENGFTIGIKRIGEMYENGEIFLPELVCAGEMVKNSVYKLEALIPEDKSIKKGKYLIGTVRGDIHDIGKDLVGTMLSSRGFEVIDIGVDCPVSKFIEKALEYKVDIIGASCLLTTTLSEIKKLLTELTVNDLRNKFKVMVGGAAVGREYAQNIGADAYGADLKEAVDAAILLLDKK